MQNSKSQASTQVQQSNEVEAMHVTPNLNKTNVSGSLLSDEAIEKYAIEKYKDVEDSRWFIPLQVGAKWARDILIKEIGSEPVINNSLLYDVDYWKQRCLAAEKYIKESPCDPDIHDDQIIAYKQWQDIVNCNDH